MPVQKSKTKSQKRSPYLETIDDSKWKYVPESPFNKDLESRIDRDTHTATVMTSGTYEDQVSRLKTMMELKVIPKEAIKGTEEQINKSQAYYPLSYYDEIIQAVHNIFVNENLIDNGMPIAEYKYLNKRFASWGGLFLTLPLPQQIAFLINAFAYNPQILKSYAKALKKYNPTTGDYWPNLIRNLSYFRRKVYNDYDDVYITIIRIHQWLELVAPPVEEEEQPKETRNAQTGDKIQNSAQEVRQGIQEARFDKRKDHYTSVIEERIGVSKEEEYRAGGGPPAFEAIHERFIADPNCFPIKWGNMRTETPPMPRSLPPGLRGRKNRATDTGGVLKYTQRWCGDKQLFASKLMTHEGGAVLIDGSGSMSLYAKDVLDILKALPAASIAIYSGYIHERNDVKYHGALRILARQGKRVDDKDIRPHGAGNEVDGPALEWLCKQEGPRFWITDGGVTFVNNPDYKPSSDAQYRQDTLLARQYFYASLTRDVTKYRVKIIRDVRTMIERDLAGEQ